MPLIKQRAIYTFYFYPLLNSKQAYYKTFKKDNEKEEGFYTVIIILFFWKILVYLVTFRDQIKTQNLLLVSPLKTSVLLTF